MDVRTLNSDVITNVVLEDLVNTRDALGNYIYFLLKHCSIQQPIAVITLGKEIDGELKEVKFNDLLEKSLGSVLSIIFWSDQQVKLRTNITNMKHTLLTGDYGTGEH